MLRRGLPEEMSVHEAGIHNSDNGKGYRGGAAPAAGGDGLTCNTDECVYCGLCAKTCPVEALTVDRAEKKWEVDKDTCVQCGACVDKCPKKCLSL